MDTVVDLFEFCRQAQSLVGEAPLAAMTRLDLVSRAGVLRWSATGGRDDARNDVLQLSIAGPLRLTCQRCLEPMTLAVDVHRSYRVAKSEAEADAMPLDDEEFDPIVGSGAFDLVALVEEEVLLSLPVVPRHARCPGQTGAAPTEPEAAVQAAAKPSPFAVLAQLKGKREAGK